MENNSPKGNIFVISGPSGVGKGTLLKMLLAKHTEISLSISATTRSPRQDEVDGVNYFFVSKEKFQESIEKGEFLEWAKFADNYYGTYKKTVENALSKGINIALEIEVQGAMQIKEKMPEAILIFISPPSIDELKSRLTCRNTETEEVIQKRLSIVESEFKKRKYFDHEIINDDLNKALEELENTILAQGANKK
ncbi:MAG: guanylate kinase [Candidatus Gastranaerophilales bacterium]|nr:guanylate kinase [Candidatus Gastranaerophilales bacterium]